MMETKNMVDLRGTHIGIQVPEAQVQLNSSATDVTARWEIAGIEMKNGGKEVIVLDSGDDEALNICNQGKEKRKFECLGIGSGSGRGGRHFSTQAEWYEYLADLGEFPGFANWLAMNENRKRKRKRIRGMLPSQEAQAVEGSKVLGSVKVLASENGVGQAPGGYDTAEGLKGTADAGYFGVPAAIKDATKEEKEEDFNSWNYWKLPLPAIDI